MFTIEGVNKPIKIWLEDKTKIEEETLKQVMNLSSLPFIHKHVALMPDCHAGYGMPIGGVIATKGVIIPNAVGVDIGCGMRFSRSNIKVSNVSRETIEKIVKGIMKRIPVGVQKHSNPVSHRVLNTISKEMVSSKLNVTELVANASLQLGTLGGGNHFLELQSDENDNLAIMLHSGSRNFGYKIAKHFDDIAKEKNELWLSQGVDGLAFLPVDSKEGQEYIESMRLALDFAFFNREIMMNIVKEEILANVQIDDVEFSDDLDVHHNYADIENHFGRNVWVHRKGAVRVREGELGIVPSAMGGYSYIVRGKGNSDSFHSCSHGAGRVMSRKKATEMIDNEDVLKDLEENGVVLGRINTNVADESKWAYKDIDTVLENEKDLIEVVSKLKTVAVIKG